jgi:hypothetical protein
MNAEITEKDIRVELLRMGVHVIGALLSEQFKQQYNVIVLACPAGSTEVSLISRVESEAALKGMAACLANTIGKPAEGLVQ